MIHSLPSDLTVRSGKSTIEYHRNSWFLRVSLEKWVDFPACVTIQGSVELTHASHATTVATLVRADFLGVPEAGRIKEVMEEQAANMAIGVISHNQWRSEHPKYMEY